VDRTKKGENLSGHERGPECEHSGNPPENRFCGHCGASLERLPAQTRELAPQEESRVTLKERFLPKRLGPVGKTVAVSLAAVAADVSLAWLRHGLEKTEQSVLPHAVSRIRREESLGGSSEYLYSYFLKEAAISVREGREIRSWFSSELTIRSSHTEK